MKTKTSSGKGLTASRRYPHENEIRWKILFRDERPLKVVRWWCHGVAWWLMMTETHLIANSICGFFHQTTGSISWLISSYKLDSPADAFDLREVSKGSEARSLWTNKWNFSWASTIFVFPSSTSSNSICIETFCLLSTLSHSEYN